MQRRHRSRSRERDTRVRRSYDHDQSYGFEHGRRTHGYDRGNDARRNSGRNNNRGENRGIRRREIDTNYQEDWPIRGGGTWFGRDERDFDNNGASHGHNQGYHHDRGSDRNSDQRNRDGQRYNRDRISNRRSNNHEQVEQQRIEISTRHPRRTFLEEVDLPLEYAFRVDTRSERISLSAARSFAYNQTPTYLRSFYASNILGASEEYISKLPGDRRCKPKLGIDEFGNVVDALTEKPIDAEDGSTLTPLILQTTPKPKRKLKTLSSDKPVKYLSLSSTSKVSDEKAGPSNSERIDFGNSLNFSHKEKGKGIQERVEQFNIQLRKEPKNVSLWKEFVKFQDQAFADTSQIFDNDEDKEKFEGARNSATGKNKKNKTKGKKKALIEKKIAILDKALEANPKCIELHIDRLDLIYEIYKPTYVLMEFRKLANVNQELDTFWFEYLRFASTQLQLFNSTSIGQVFEKTIDKFRTMLTPSYPNFQRPAKCHLVLADLLFSICILLRNAGFTERSVAIHQAQLEMDFNLPIDIKSKNKDDWKNTVASFEEFWNSSSVRFGEPGSTGWKQQEKIPADYSPISSFILDSQVSSFEDTIFSSINGFELDNSQLKPNTIIWLYVESLRSKLYWVPWRATKASDLTEVETCDDSQRIILPGDITPFISNVSRETYSSEFERQSVYFRHLVNLLLTLREDFLPRTHTLDSILPIFANVGMCDSRTLFSEIYFWKKRLNFYHTNSNPKVTISADTDTSDIPVPEGFRLNDFIVSSQSNEIESTKTLIPKFPDSIEEMKENLLKQSEVNHLNFVRSVVQQSLDHLDVKFASIIVQTLIRFEQRNTYSSKENQKSRMKYMKNLMKHDKLRGATGIYGQLAMLEYYGGSKVKAIELLVKSINSSRKNLRECETEAGLELHSEQIAEVTQLYKFLAEFYLRESPEIALKVLIALGNKFAEVDVSVTGSEDKPNTNALLKAKKFFEFVMNWLLPKNENEEIDMDTDVDFGEKINGDKCIEFLLQDVNLIVEWTSVYALFRYLSGDFDSASDLYMEVMEKTNSHESLSRSTRYKTDVIFRNNIREQLYVNLSKLSALVLSTMPMQHSKFRNILCKALQEFPSSPALLLLFTDVESQCSIVGKLWRAMVSIVKQDSSQNTVSLHWAPLFMTFGLAQQIEKLEQDEKIGLDSFGLGGPAVPPDTIFYKLDALLTAAELNTLSRNVPLIWRVHLKHLILRANQGKDVMRARGLFYDAIRHCPSSKAIYMDGIAYFPDMNIEIYDLMIEKGIMVRLPREELDLLMEIDNELENEVIKVENQKQKNNKLVIENKPEQVEENENNVISLVKSNKRKQPESDLKIVKSDKDINISSLIKSYNPITFPTDTKKFKPAEDSMSASVSTTDVVILSDGEIDECETVEVSE